jgi:hypothetical protein
MSVIAVDEFRVDCAVCHQVALLTPEALLKLGLSPAGKVLDLAIQGLGAAGADRGGEPLFRSGGGVRTADLRLL